METALLLALAGLVYWQTRTPAAPADPSVPPGDGPVVNPPNPPPVAPVYGPTSEPWEVVFATALREADGQVYDRNKARWSGGSLTQGAVRVFIAHAAVETGGGAYLQDNNAWNMIEVRKGKPYRVRTDRGSATDVDPTKAGSQQHFAVFATPRDCAVRYLALIRAYYPAALAGAMKGDPRAYAIGLRHGRAFEGTTNERRWYEAPESRMVAAITDRMPTPAQIGDVA